jgi:eukaryotic-like serine/threonine-protein kinase
VLKCLAKAREDRPQSISEVLQALEKIQAEVKPASGSLSAIHSLPEPPPNKAAPLDAASTATSKFPAVDRTVVGQSGTKTNHTYSSQTYSSIEPIFFQTAWPKDKPQQKIVFPDLIATPKGMFATLWVMLDRKDIIERVSSKRYNQFLFLLHPHPMLLWITLIYNREQGPRWLPCYLDLKTDKGQQVVSVLSQSESYRVLFFDIHGSGECQHVMTSSIAPKNRQRLKYWVNTSQLVKGSGQPQTTKNLLKQEYEKLKPKILLRLESIGTEFPSDSSE